MIIKAPYRLWVTVTVWCLGLIACSHLPSPGAGTYFMPRFLQATPLVWQQLQATSVEQLKQQTQTASSETEAGWVKLALISKTVSRDPVVLTAEIIDWRRQYPEHPGNQLLPYSVDSAVVFAKPIQQIGLLLPLEGTYGPAGQAIRNGFLAAYYRSHPATAIRIRFYDTSAGVDVAALYQQAVNEGAEAMVGPLNKEDVEALARGGNIRVPTVALNYLSGNGRVSSYFYQLGISPEAEAQQVAARMQQDNRHAVIIISEATPWGQRLQSAFQAAWEGRVVATLSLSPSDDVRMMIRHLLGADDTRSHARTQTGRKDTRAHRRTDFDSFFFVATPETARQWRPYLDFYYAGQVPVYSTSIIYSGLPNAGIYSDLNHVFFCDMPWLLSSEPRWQAQRQHLAHTWSASSFSTYARLYALGQEAYRVVNALNQYAVFPGLQLSSLTGTLSLNSDQQIQRRLPWAEFINGSATLLP